MDKGVCSRLLTRIGMTLFVLGIFGKLATFGFNERLIFELSRYVVFGGMIVWALGVLIAHFGEVSS